MLKTYDFVNEQGEKVISKTIQYEKKEDDSFGFYNSNMNISILYDLPKVIENVKNNNVIYFVTCVDMVETLKISGKFATCLVTNTYNKKKLEQSLKYLKGATIYIIVDNNNSKKEIKEDIKSDQMLEQVFNSIAKTNKNILKILVDIAKEVRLIDYNEQHKNYNILNKYKNIGDLFGKYAVDYNLDYWFYSYYNYKDESYLIDKSWKELIANGIIVTKSNYTNIYRQYKFKFMLFDILDKLIK